VNLKRVSVIRSANEDVNVGRNSKNSFAKKNQGMTATWSCHKLTHTNSVFVHATPTRYVRDFNVAGQDDKFEDQAKSGVVRLFRACASVSNARKPPSRMIL
jgi:hypothetical protein